MTWSRQEGGGNQEPAKYLTFKFNKAGETHVPVEAYLGCSTLSRKSCPKHMSQGQFQKLWTVEEFEVNILASVQSIRKRNLGIFSSGRKQTLPGKVLHGFPAQATPGVQGKDSCV